MSLKGKTAVITGGAGGIGRAICLQLAEDGAAISIWDTNIEGAQETARLINDKGGRAIALKTDVASSSSIGHAIERTRDFFESMGIRTRLSGYGLGAEVIDTVITQLEAHGMVKLGEQREITPAVSRRILEAAL